jgi:hypothetical protein
MGSLPRTKSGYPRQRWRNSSSTESSCSRRREREWFSKTPIHVLRLAGTLTYIRCAAFGDQDPTEVDIVSMKAAIRLVRDYFWPHSRAVLDRIGGECRNATARRIVRWIFESRKTEVSVQDVRRTALGGSIDAKQAKEILGTLVDCGLLREMTGEIGVKGGRSTVRWLVNPKAKPSAETAETAETSQPIEFIDSEVSAAPNAETAETYHGWR